MALWRHQKQGSGLNTTLLCVLSSIAFLLWAAYNTHHPHAESFRNGPNAQVHFGQSQQDAEPKTDQHRSSPAHIYIVGCGHSGTSFFLRTIGNLPGIMCISIESNVYLSDHNYVQNTTQPMTKEEEATAMATLQDWDKTATKGSYAAWVEKTPRHVSHLARIFKLDPDAYVLFLVRDARDVGLSYVKRGRQFEEALDRWVADNSAALPYLDDLRVLIVKFEELSSFEKALPVLENINDFLSHATGIKASPARLLMSLLPPAKPYGSFKELCNQYPNDDDKFEDLTKSQLLLMQGDLKERAEGMPENEDHRRYRSWQMMQPWFASDPAWPKDMTPDQKKIFDSNKEAQKLMKLFHYIQD